MATGFFPGHLWHTLRRPDGSWTGAGDAQAVLAIPQDVAAVAGTGGAPGETQFMFTTADGHLWHTLRHADGSWTGLGDAQGVLGVTGVIVAVAAANGGAGETQFMFTTADGHLWHTVRRRDGSWTGLGDAQAVLAVPGPVTAVAGTGGAPGETQFMFATGDGHLWHTLRRADGSWTGLGDVQAQFGVPGPVVAVAAANGGAGETQFMFATRDGHLWHTLRRADGSWTGLGDAQAVLGVPGGVGTMAAANGTPGETQFMLTGDGGHLWHTLRRADGGWTGLGDAQAALPIPAPFVGGSFAGVAAADGGAGETQFMFVSYVLVK
jgi:hypothetical protein